MDQQLIAVIVLFGVRFVLLAIPVFDNFWLWAMRRFLQWRNCGNGASATNFGEGYEPQLFELTRDRSSRRREQLPIQDGILLQLLI